MTIPRFEQILNLASTRILNIFLWVSSRVYTRFPELVEEECKRYRSMLISISPDHPFPLPRSPLRRWRALKASQPARTLKQYRKPSHRSQFTLLFKASYLPVSDVLKAVLGMSPLFQNSTPVEEVPILIIGGGPSGLLLAFLLEQLNGNSI